VRTDEAVAALSRKGPPPALALPGYRAKAVANYEDEDVRDLPERPFSVALARMLLKR
jgi:hypothetical protein